MRSLALLHSCYSCLLCCALVAVQAFKPGMQYTYQYETRVVLRELQQHESKQAAQLTLAANLSLSRLQFSNGVSALRLHFLTAAASNGLAPTAQDLLPPVSEFLLAAHEARSPHWLGSVITTEDEDPFWLNLARGVASLLRYQDEGGSAGSREADTAGECGFAFAWLDGARRRQLEKRTEACENVELAGERNQDNPLFAVRRSGGATTVFEFSVDEAAPPVSVHSTETHELLPDLPSGFGLHFLSKSRAHVVDAISGNSGGSDAAPFETLSAYLQSTGRPTREVALPTAMEFERSDQTGSLTQFLTRLPSYLRDANPSMHSLAIVQGLPLARGAKDQMELRKQLELESNKPHLPDIMELYSACGTKPCIGALFDFVAKRLTDLSDDLLERLLLALSQSSRVRRPLLDRTLDLLKRLEAASRWTAARAAYQTLATLGRKYSSAGGPDSEVPNLLLDRLADCEVTSADTAESTDCQLAVLSAMTNCPSPRYRQLLIRGLLVNATAGSQVTMARLRALQASGPLIPSERQHLAGLLKQRHIPLSDPIRYTIADALGGPAACAEAGVDCRSLRRGADLWLPLRRRYRQSTSAGHEEVLAGLTSSGFHRSRLFSIDGNGGSVDYELDMLGNRLGGIRLSEFRLGYARPPAAKAIPPSLTDVLGVRLYADAIDSLLDSGSSSGSASGGSNDLEEEATAGMQLGVMGEWLRPRRFFTGTSALMSAVWNAPESPVGVLQSGFLMHDFATRVHLLNGLVVEATLNGALALNVSGSLSVSIWNRDATSKVLNSIGLTLYAKAGLRTGRFSIDFVSQAQAELLNTFATFVAFAETPVRTCLVMSNSPVAVTQSCHVTDTIGPRYDHHSHDFYVPGRSFSLGIRNDRLCKELASDSDDE